MAIVPDLSKNYPDSAIGPDPHIATPGGTGGGGAGDASAANQVLTNTAIGAPTDASALSDTGTFSLIALTKRLLTGVASMVTSLSSLAGDTSTATVQFTDPANDVSGTTAAMTATASTQVLAAPGAGLRNYITTIVVSNSHATVGTDVVIQDGNGGAALMTIPAAALFGGAAISLPVPLRQPTANNALFCVNSVTGASTKVSAVGYKGV